MSEATRRNCLRQPTSKALVVGSRVDPLLASQLHQSVITHGAVSAASAIVCGLELQRIQKALKSAPGCTFDEWLEKYEAQLGFTRRTAFKYKAAAADTRAKLLKKGDAATLRLLNIAPGSMTPEQRTKLLKTVSKCIGAQTLTDIYLEAGIVKNIHKAPLRIGGGDDPADIAIAIDLDQEVAEQLELFGRNSLLLQKTIKVGKEDVLLISRWPKAKIETAIDVRKREIQMLIKVKGAMK